MSTALTVKLMLPSGRGIIVCAGSRGVVLPARTRTARADGAVYPLPGSASSRFVKGRKQTNEEGSPTIFRSVHTCVVSVLSLDHFKSFSILTPQSEIYY